MSGVLFGNLEFFPYLCIRNMIKTMNYLVSRTYRYVLSLAMLLGLSALAYASGSDAPSGLDAKSFKKYWHVESESPDYKVTFSGDTAEIFAPKGLTLWRNEKMSGNTTIEYDACISDTGKEGDRLSDLNCFWMASDPKFPADIRKRAAWRKGIFVNCYSLQLYYLGFGGNHNSTTRFRRYDGNEAGVNDVNARPKILKEYTDKAHLLEPNKWYHIKITNDNGRVQYFINGERLVDFLDPSPLTEGWFGFRTTAARARIANFSFTCTKPQPADVPLHRVGAAPSSQRGAMFGVPFDQGAVTVATDLQLLGGDGSQIAADTWPLAYWPDGSIKWSGVAATIPAGADDLTVRIAGKKKKANKMNTQAPIATNLGNEIKVSTGLTDTYIAKQGSALIDSIVRGGVRVAVDGRLVCSTQSEPVLESTKQVSFVNYVSKVDSAVIERQGNEHAVIKINGKLRSGNGREWLPFLVRLYFYRSTPEVKMVYTMFYDGDQNADYIRSLGVRFDVPMREALYNRHVAFATTDGGVWSEPVQPLVGRRVLMLPGDTSKVSVQERQMLGERIPEYDAFDEKGHHLIDNWASWDAYRLSQLDPDGFTIRKRANDNNPWIGTMAGTRADGYAFVGDVSGGLGIQLKDFWESYPSTLEVSGARTPMATVTAWLWSPESEPMDLRHYANKAHDLLAAYEDVQEGMSTPYGVARTSTLILNPGEGYRGKKQFALDAASMNTPGLILPTPEYLHDRRAFGVWSLPDRSTENRAKVEDRLEQYIDFYKNAVEQNRWYGFWHYGDFMHAYDPVRHEWKYDVGGYAWDNTELGSNLWLWYSFLRTGREDIWRMAEAMGRHVGEVDVYHFGDNAGLGSRHNVSHWGCGAKEARISQAAFNRFMYYLTADDRSGDLMTAVRDNDQKLYTLDPMRLAEPRDKYPCTAPARLRIGPDWLAYAGNWMTEWERTGNTAYRDKIIAGMKSICKLPGRMFTGPLALGYDPATGIITSECDPNLRTTNHLMTIMGGFEVNNELMNLIPDAEWEDAWLEHATDYKAMARKILRNKFRVSRLAAYSAWQRQDKAAADEAWHDLLTTSEHTVAPPFYIYKVDVPDVPAPIDEASQISTNDAAMWSLDAIYMQEVIPQD